MFFKSREDWLKLIGCIVLGAGLLSVVVFLPVRQTRTLPEKEQVMAEIAARDVLVKGIGGSLVFVTAFIGLETLKTEKEKQVSERFLNAVEMMSHKDLHTRLGGIYALERIARDSEKDHWQVMDVLAAFVREKASPSSEDNTNRGNSSPYVIESLEERKDKYYKEQSEPCRYDIYDTRPEDWEILFGSSSPNYKRLPSIELQAAVSAIGRRRKVLSVKDRHVIDLSRINLKDIEFKGNYENIDFSKTCFQCSVFKEANFNDSNLSEAFFQQPKFENSTFERASFRKAIIGLPILENTKFDRACFREARFSDGVIANNCSFIQANLQSFRLGTGVPIEPLFEKRNSLFVSFEQRNKFQGTSFKSSNLTDAVLWDTTFENCTFERSLLKKTVIQGITFSDCNLSNVSLEESRIGDDQTQNDYFKSYGYYSKKISRRKDVVFEKTELRLTKLDKAVIYSANFEGALGLTAEQIESASNWKNAKYALKLQEQLSARN